MPYPNQHAARLISPGRFEKGSFRTITLKPGVSAIIGKLKGQTTTRRQAIRFDKSKFTTDQAKEWLKDNKLKYISFEPATGGSMKAFISLQAVRMTFSESDILSMIPAADLSRIKQKDAHPFFQVFSICHPGISRPRILGQSEQTPIEWTRRAVQSIKNVALRGIKAFFRHNEDSSTVGRRPLGKVVANVEREIGGEPHHLVVMYHKPSDVEEAKQMDICSQEGDWNLIDAGKKLIAYTVNRITAIALSKSSLEKPAFSGAVKLGMVQAFDNDGGESDTKESGDDKTMTFEEVKQAVKSMNIHAWQLFSETELRQDKEYGKLFDENDQLKTDNEKLKKDMQAKEEAYLKESQKATSKQRFDKMLADNKATDKMKEFFEVEFDSYGGDLSDEGLKSFFESGVPKYKKLVEKGILTDNSQVDNREEPTGNGDDFTKAENNEFLKDDY